MRATVYRTTGYLTRSIILASQLGSFDLDDDDEDCDGDLVINEDEEDE
jgi:hypothetical protein